MKKYIELIRLKHWIKNILIFLPLFFSHSFKMELILNTFIGFLSFSFISSFIYIINDIRDIDKDKNHPRKKNRPIANGSISIKKAYIISIIFLVFSLLLNFIITKNIFTNTLLYLLIYIAVNITYSYGLKNIAIVDVFLLASGFIIRVYYGASVIGVEVSKWLFLTILNGALFLGLVKRKKELLFNKNVRTVLKEYDETFLNNYINISITLVIVFYSLWAIEQVSKCIFITIPMLNIIIMQYMLTYEKNDEGDPITLLFQNKLLLGSILLFGIIMIISFALL